MQQLLAYEQIDKPVYDYTLHTRSEEIIPVEPKDVIILEGILILEDPRLCKLMDIKLFVDTDADLRILRRMQRDIKERGRTMDSVIDQYVNVVRQCTINLLSLLRNLRILLSLKVDKTTLQLILW